MLRRQLRQGPVLRLLRKLRPRSRPSPAVAASPVPCWAGKPSSRVPIPNLGVGRRWALPLAIRGMGLGEPVPSRARYSCPAAQMMTPRRVGSLSPHAIARCGAVPVKVRGVSRPLRCLAMDTAVARPTIDGRIRYSSGRSAYDTQPATPGRAFRPPSIRCSLRRGGISAAGRRSASLRGVCYFMATSRAVTAHSSPPAGSLRASCRSSGTDFGPSAQATDQAVCPARRSG